VFQTHQVLGQIGLALLLLDQRKLAQHFVHVQHEAQQCRLRSSTTLNTPTDSIGNTKQHAIRKRLRSKRIGIGLIGNGESNATIVLLAISIRFSTQHDAAMAIVPDQP
jgi:hypothetical protein